MADTLATDVKASLTWLFQEALDLSTVADSSKLEYARSLADGTAVDQADKIWHDTRTVNATSNDDLDLTALTTSVFGSTLSISFAKIKAILIVNTATTSGEKLQVGAATSAAITSIFGGVAASVVEVGPDSALLVSNKKDGWSVTNSTADVLRVRNPGASPVTYKITIVGTSA